MEPTARQKAWLPDQVAKSEHFHKKLHEWGVLEVAEVIERVQGEHLEWEVDGLEISAIAWKKVIHRGIKPIVVFAHPTVLSEVYRAVSYYRMLSMVSLKSMNNVGLPCNRYEEGKAQPKPAEALALAQHFNRIVSRLIEADEELTPREFDLWRGMAAGTQAQGSWQNVKGRIAEELIRTTLHNHLLAVGLLLEANENELVLADGRRLVFASEPDIVLYSSNNTILAAVEVKGGVDTAGVLERVGAAVKSLSRTKRDVPEALTILILQEVSLTTQAQRELEAHQPDVNYWFPLEAILAEESTESRFFSLLSL